MSNMLNQVIVDAEALKEVAIKNAEAAIVEKYSNDIKKAVDQLLEQGPSPEEMAMMGAPGGAPGGMAPPPPGTPGAPGGSDFGSGEGLAASVPEAQMDAQRTVTVNLSELVEEMKMDELNPSEKQMHELVAEEVTGGEEVAAEERREVITIQESVISDILGEDLEEDEGPDPMWEGEYEEDLYEEDLYEEDLYGEGDYLDEQWDELEEQGLTPTPPPEIETPPPLEIETPPPAEPAPTPPLEIETPPPVEPAPTPPPEIETPPPGATMEERRYTEAVNRLQRALQDYQYDYTKLYESHQTYEQDYAQLHQQAGQLHEQNNKFRKILVKVQEKLNEVNVRNAHLHYTNRTLTSDSLNERQKDKIVEAIEKADTVEEAKIIFETLQSAVAGIKSTQDAPKSLNEAINKRSSAFLPRNEEKQSDLSFADRMQRLAGIK